MSAHHFFLPSIEGDTLVVEGDDARHAVRVLRIRPGETITISDGKGGVATAVVDAVDRTMTARVTGRRSVPPMRPALTVYQALPKTGKLEHVVQSLTQCGVAAVVPFRAERSIARWDESKAAANVARLRAVAHEAAMQSRRARLMAVGDVIDAGRIPGDAIVLHEAAAERLATCLSGEVPDELAIVIGPEGGFSDLEIESFRSRGCPVASLGDLVLRAETAPLVAAAVVLTRYGALG